MFNDSIHDSAIPASRQPMHDSTRHFNAMHPPTHRPPQYPNQNGEATLSKNRIYSIQPDEMAAIK